MGWGQVQPSALRPGAWNPGSGGVWEPHLKAGCQGGDSKAHETWPDNGPHPAACRGQPARHLAQSCHHHHLACPAWSCFVLTWDWGPEDTALAAEGQLLMSLGLGP